MKSSNLHEKCQLIMKDFTYDPEDIIVRRMDLEESIMENIGYDDRTISRWMNLLIRFRYIEKGGNQYSFKLGKKGLDLLPKCENQKPVEDYGNDTKLG